LDAFLEVNVLVPEWVALGVETDEMSAALEETKLLVLCYNVEDRYRERGEACSLLCEMHAAESALGNPIKLRMRREQPANV
jgi:hypothetical protein